MMPGKGTLSLLGAFLLVLGASLSLAMMGRPGAAMGPIILGPGILLLGFGSGRAATWGAVLAAFLFTLFLWMHASVGGDTALAGAALLAANALFSLFFAEHGEDEAREFDAKWKPLSEEREQLRASLEDLRTRALAAERRGRETDALFHAGREISKLLSLADTLEFSREVLHDTLKLPDAGAVPAFVVALADTDNSAFSIGVAEGLDEAQVHLLAQGPEKNGFCRWLRQAGGVLVDRVAAEPGLKGVPLPPGVRSLLSVPLVIQEQAIGWVVVFDTGDFGLPERDFSNLKILCSQIAIGLEKATLYDRLQRLSVTDGLTGLTVHRHFQSRLDEELKRAERYREPLSLVMSDIDNFKTFNDTWGHLAGDAVLKAVAGVLKLGLGPSEMAVRYGGEEFVMVLPRHTKEMAVARAEALREAVKALRVDTESAPERLNVTISLGVATYPDDAMTKIGLIDMADGALYQSKKGGRDQVTAAKPPSA
jgi:diguanylate cyclase (GGDEF)-like protein